MTELLIFTLLATTVALYNILPEHRKIRVNYLVRRRRWQFWIISLLGVIISLYAVDQYIQITETPAVQVYNWFPVDTGLEFRSRYPLVFSQLLISIILLGSLALAFFTMLFSKGDEDYLVAKLREYYNRTEFGTLVDLITENYHYLLHRETTPVPTAASRTRDYLLNSDFAQEHPTIAPELGIRIIGDSEIESSFKEDFTREFIRTQVRTENSLLRREVSENQIIEDLWKYPIQDENELLDALLSDISTTEDLAINHAVGTAVTEILREQGRQDYDSYHEPRLSLYTNSKDYAFYDPVFSGIQFMNLLIVRSIEENQDWHMNLSEFMTITRLICDNYEITSASDPDAEWPTDYAFFLYTVFEAMIDWIRIVEYEYENKSDYSIDLNTVDSQWTGSIAKSGVVCLFNCHQSMMTTDNISDDYKDYISMMIFRQWLSLREYDITTLPYWYGKQMEYCFKNNIGKTSKQKKYLAEMQQVFRRQKTEIKIEDKQMTGLASDLNSILF